MDLNTLKPETKELLKNASEVYSANFGKSIWFGRCIFLSWYCTIGTCTFCYRTTIKHKIKHAKSARRSIPSVLVEPLLAKKLGWRIEFLTGGYGIFPMPEIIEIARKVHVVYGKKIWLNLGALNNNVLEKFTPYIEGVVASVETVNPKIHQDTCPDKPMKPYESMLVEAKKLGLKTSITIVVGLGQTEKDIDGLHKFIHKFKIDRITFYALKPVTGTPFKEGPKPEFYATWIARTRIEFPKIEIIAGTTARRIEEVELLLRAGANAITKFPSTKMFGNERAHIFEEKVKAAGREFESNLTVLPEDIDWNAEIDSLKLDDEMKTELKEKLELYLVRMRKTQISKEEFLEKQKDKKLQNLSNNN